MKRDPAFPFLSLDWGAQAASLQLPAACRQYVRTSESDSGKICFGKLPKPAGWQPALPKPETEKEMPDRASLAIRHLVDVSNQTKTELCVTVVSLSLDFFRCRGLHGMPSYF